MAASIEQHLFKIRSPFGGEKVYKDECVFSYDTPECETGLYICMNTFLGIGKAHVERYFRKTANAVFLHMRRIKREIPKAPEEEVPKKKPTRLAIGVEGGFDIDDASKYEVEELNSIVVLPEWTEIPLPNTELPPAVQISAAAILAADSAAKQEEASALAGTWDGEKLLTSKHAENLKLLDNGKKIPPQGWKCEMCEKTDNLWLNLTDGSILCGRKFWDGSGGNNHAVDHYKDVKHPLAVKLGTITPDGGDVYSYDEDDMVQDPYLAQHLAHWGIDIMKMEKTDKTMVELEININQRIGEWDVIQEAGSKLEPIYGSGYTGIRNLGNSCYLNSVMQSLFIIPDFVQRYYAPCQDIFNHGPADPTDDFTVQMAKFGHGLLSGAYSKVPPPSQEDEAQPRVVHPVGICPHMFKTLVGRGHSEFSTKRQQDAQEFLLHLFTLIERNSRGAANPTDSLKFEMEERLECVVTKQVKYTHRTEYMLSLPIPMDAATNKEAVKEFEAKKKQLEAEEKTIYLLDPKEMVRPRIPLASCIEEFLAGSVIEGCYVPAAMDTGMVNQTCRMASFPDFLLLHMKKFTLGQDWVPKKLDVSLDVPDELDITALRGMGLQPGESLIPDGEPTAEAAPAPPVVVDESVVTQLMEMGFPQDGCRRAVHNTQNTGVESAMNWVMEHMGDPDFASPFEVPGNFVADQESLAMVMSMGFTLEQATKALKATGNNTERAVDWIFSHPQELEQPMESDPAPLAGAAAPPAAPPRGQFRDGNPKYKLVGFISHMGASTLVGHYVCHLLKDGRWVIFNDEKVCLSENPPKDLAYLYLYQRM